MPLTKDMRVILSKNKENLAMKSPVPQTYFWFFFPQRLAKMKGLSNNNPPCLCDRNSMRLISMYE